MQVGAQLYIYQQRSVAEFGRPFGEALDKALAAVQAAGYAGVELTLDALNAPGTLERLGTLLARYGLQLPSVYCTAQLHTGDVPETVWTLLERMAEVKYLGVHTLVVNPTPERQRSKTSGELATEARWLDQLGSQLQGRGMDLALHFHAPELRHDGQELWYALEHTTPANLGLCLDVDWAWRGGVDPVRIIRASGPRIVELHLRDSRNGTWVQALGEGTHDYAPVIAALRAVGFDGWLYAELADEPGCEWTRSVRDNLALSRTWIARTFGV